MMTPDAADLSPPTALRRESMIILRVRNWLASLAMFFFGMGYVVMLGGVVSNAIGIVLVAVAFACLLGSGLTSLAVDGQANRFAGGFLVSVAGGALMWNHAQVTYGVAWLAASGDEPIGEHASPSGEHVAAIAANLDLFVLGWLFATVALSHLIHARRDWKKPLAAFGSGALAILLTVATVHQKVVEHHHIHREYTAAAFNPSPLLAVLGAVIALIGAARIYEGVRGPATQSADDVTGKAG